jgi:type IV secretory pathway TrbF-like protein
MSNKNKTKIILGKELEDLDYGAELVPTLDRERKYVEFFGGWVAFGKWCLILAILAMVSVIVSNYWAITVQRGITKEVQIVLADSIGRLSPVSSVNQSVTTLQKDPNFLASQLAAYIIGLRTISPDFQVTKQLYLKTKRMTDPQLQPTVRKLLEEHFAGVQDGTSVQPVIQKVSPVPPDNKSWIIEWKEVINGRDDPGTTTYWTAIVNIDFFKPTDPDVIWDDPLGILVKSLTIQQANYFAK